MSVSNIGFSFTDNSIAADNAYVTCACYSYIDIIYLKITLKSQVYLRS